MVRLVLRERGGILGPILKEGTRNPFVLVITRPERVPEVQRIVIDGEVSENKLE